MSKVRETLAETYLRSGRPHRNSHQYYTAIKVDELVKICLTPPGAHTVLMRNPETAERYVFEESPLELVGQMVDSGALDTRLMAEAVVLPAGNTWMEFRNRKLDEHCGILVHRQDSGMLLIALCLEMDGLAVPGMMIEIKDLPWRFADTHPKHPGDVGEYVEVLWECTPYDKYRTGRRAQQLMHDTLSCLFLLSVPRICEIRSRVSRAERMRARDPKQHPAVEFKHVKMTIGVGAPRYEGGARRLPGETDEQHRTRLHRVTHHFRTYRYKPDGALRERPLVKYIDDHWRGDASRGILLHERSVRAKKEG